MKKLARNTLALGTATLIVTAGLSFSANGADATKSYATGRFLSGSIGGTNLDALAQLKGVTAANPGNPGPNTNPLNLTLLSTLPINIPGGLKLDLAKFLSASGNAGAVNQFAGAPSTSKATGASGLVSDSGAVLAPSSTTPPTDAHVTLLDGPLGGINSQLAGVDLLLGALSSNTTVNGGTPTRDYQIAGLKLQLKVPLLASLVGDLTTATNPLGAPNVDDITLSPAQLCPLVGSTLNVAVSTLLTQLRTPALNLSAVADLIEPILTTAGLTQVDLCNVNPLLQIVGGLTSGPIGQLISVNVTGLGGLLSGVSDLSGSGIDVDLTGADAGTVTIDLEKILAAANVNLNDLPPNTDILQFLTNNLVSDKIAALLDSLISNVVGKLGAVNATVTVAGTQLPLTLNQLTDPVSTALVSLLNSVTDAVKTLGNGIDPLLNDLVPNLQSLVKLTGNNQSTSKTPTLNTGTVNAGNVGTAAVGDYYRTSALKINVLTSTLNVDLAASEAAVLAAPAVVDGAAAAAAADDSDAPADNAGDNADAVTDADSQADANADANADTVADADAQADADVTTTLPSTGAPNLLPFWLLGIALLLFGGAVLVNEKRRLNQG